jgi:hypothetical protein|tara:strand:+ start:131 stop:574 length:444 start_codon:yes stop_codon:yes gene_type:complete
MGDFWMVRSKEELDERINYFHEFLRDTWDWTKPVAWKVSIYRPARSQSQNALFHIWCREMSEHFKSQGMDLDQEQCKEVLKYKFLGCADIVVNNTVIPQQLKKTSKLPTGEMYHFMEQVQSFLLDHGVKLTCPDDSEFMKLRRGGSR